MRLLAEEGRTEEALRQFEACAAGRRAAGLGPPSLASEALRDAIAAGELGPSSRPAPAGEGLRMAAQQLVGLERLRPLRGREGGVASLEALLVRGHGLAVLLGEQGAGATRLALEAARMAEEHGAVVRWASARRSPQTPGGLFAGLRPPGALGADPAATLGAALAAAAGGRPTFLLLDDLHLADAESLAQLVALARRAIELSLVVVATCREDAIHAGTPIQRCLAALDAERLARGFHVSRLTSAGTLAMICDLLEAAPSPALAAAVYEASDGLPARVEALVAAWASGGVLPGSPAASPIAPPGGPAR